MATMKVPCMKPGCSEHSNEYLPGARAGTLYVVDACPATTSPWNRIGEPGPKAVEMRKL